MVGRHMVLFGVAVAVSAGLVIGNEAGVWSVHRPSPAERHIDPLDGPDDRLAVVKARTEAKEALIRRLIAGELRLTEVTAVFLRMHAEDPTYDLVIRTHYPAPTLAAGVAQNVIRVARLRLDDYPDRPPGVMARLTAEYEAEYGGTLPCRVAE